MWTALTDSTALVQIDSEFKQDTTYPAFKSAVPFLAAYPKIILDLRGNRGGSIDAVDSIIEYFLPANTPFIEARYRKYDPASRTARTVDWEPWATVHDHSPTLVGARVAILTDGLTASASEILAAGLKDGRAGSGPDTATLVGQTTFGKGIGQIVISRSYLGKRDIQITFLRLKGLSDRTGIYHRRGIFPDLRVTGPLLQLNTALHVLEPSAPILIRNPIAFAKSSAPLDIGKRVPADPLLEQ